MSRSWKNRRKFVAVLVGVCLFGVGATSADAATTKPTPKPTVKATAKATATKKATPAASAKKTPAKSSATSAPIKVGKDGKIYSGNVNISNFGYTGRKDASDTTIKPVLDKIILDTLKVDGVENSIADVASASKIMKLVITDLKEANIECTPLSDPLPSTGITLSGSIKSDTLAGCAWGDPNTTGFYEFIITDKATVQKYFNATGIDLYKKYSTPMESNLESTYFTPSLKAVIFTVGGQYSFDANEITWAVLYNMGFTPPTR